MTTEYICCDCEKPCGTVKIDEGYESSEFWGSVQHDKVYTFVSDCCQDDLLEKDEAFEALGDNHLQQELF